MSVLTAEPTVAMAAEAVRRLYHDPDPKHKEQASIWLQEMQKSVLGWKICDQILHQGGDMELCYFAAQTLRTKVQTMFHELPVESHASFRDSLMEHVSKLGEETYQVILMQICLAVADLMLQMPQWEHPVQDVIRRFRSTKPYVLLEILVVLPEEVHSRHLRLGANRRREITEELRRASPELNEFLIQCLQHVVSPNIEDSFRSNIFRCLMSWITLGAIPLDDLNSNPVMSAAFQTCANISAATVIHEAAVDAVCALLERLEEYSEERNGTGPLELGVFTLLRQLEGPYRECVASEDLFKVISFCRVFTEYAEAMLMQIVSQPPQQPHFAISILDVVLLCCEHLDYEVPDVTFNLWYRLSEELYRKDDDALNSLFRPYVQRLIQALYKHCQMEPDHDDVLEEGEDFTEFRIRVVELIKDIVFIVGSVDVFKNLFHELQNPNSWEATEAALFIMSAVGRNIPPQVEECVPQVLESVLSLPESSTHIAVRHTSFRLVGELSEWIDRHPHYLEKILNWIVIGLNNPKLSGEAANALLNLCCSCRSHMSLHFEGLVQILSSLDTFNLKPAAGDGLIKGVAVLLADMPYDRITQAMRRLSELQVGPLVAILEAQKNDGFSQPIPKHAPCDPVLYLDRLATVFRHTTPRVPEGNEHPCKAVALEVWPVLSRTFERFAGDARITERCCRTVRFVVRCVRTQAAPMLEPLVKQMVTTYQAHPHSCFLYLGSILVDEFSYIEGCIPGLLSMLTAFLPRTFQLLQAENGLRNHPDTVDDFFRLNARFLQRIPVPYLSAGEHVGQIIECGLLAVNLDHKEANASVLKFFFDLLHCGRSRQEKPDFETRQTFVLRLKDDSGLGERLVHTLINAVVLILPGYTICDVSDILYELMLFDRAKVCVWLEKALKELPRVNSSGTETVTLKQLAAFHKDVTKAEGTKDVVEAVRQFTRLWR